MSSCSIMRKTERGERGAPSMRYSSRRASEGRVQNSQWIIIQSMGNDGIQLRVNSEVVVREPTRMSCHELAASGEAAARR